MKIPFNDEIGSTDVNVFDQTVTEFIYEMKGRITTNTENKTYARMMMQIKSCFGNEDHERGTIHGLRSDRPSCEKEDVQRIA